jgi:hypothetical protein
MVDVKGFSMGKVIMCERDVHTTIGCDEVHVLHSLEK